MQSLKFKWQVQQFQVIGLGHEGPEYLIRDGICKDTEVQITTLSVSQHIPQDPDDLSNLVHVSHIFLLNLSFPPPPTFPEFHSSKSDPGSPSDRCDFSLLFHSIGMKWRMSEKRVGTGQWTIVKDRLCTHTDNKAQSQQPSQGRASVSGPVFSWIKWD